MKDSIVPSEFNRRTDSLFSLVLAILGGSLVMIAVLWDGWVIWRVLLAAIGMAVIHFQGYIHGNWKGKYDQTLN